MSWLWVKPFMKLMGNTLWVNSTGMSEIQSILKIGLFWTPYESMSWITFDKLDPSFTLELLNYSLDFHTSFTGLKSTDHYNTI